MPKVNRKNQIKRTLEAAGIYDPKLDSQIALTVRQEKLLERLHSSLEKSNILEVEISASGSEKQVINPLVQFILKLESQLQDSYAALGLNYNAKPANIRESAVPDKGETGVKTFLDEIL